VRQSRPFEERIGDKIADRAGRGIVAQIDDNALSFLAGLGREVGDAFSGHPWSAH